MQKKSKNRKTTADKPESFMVHFTCQFTFEGDVFVNTKRKEAAKVAKKLLAGLDYQKLSELALYSYRKNKVGRVISERAVQKALGRDKEGGSVPSPFVAPAIPQLIFFKRFALSHRGLFSWSRICPLCPVNDRKPPVFRCNAPFPSPFPTCGKGWLRQKGRKTNGLWVGCRVVSAPDFPRFLTAHGLRSPYQSVLTNRGKSGPKKGMA